MMNKLYIASKGVNLEILAKLLNSVARKYDCHVGYDKQENSLEFIGDESYWRHIAEETMAFIFPKSEMVPVTANNASAHPSCMG